MIEDGLHKVLSLVLLVILLFCVPLYYTLIRLDRVTQNVVTVQTERFADSIRDLGYITPNMYKEYISSIEGTGLNYNVDIKHYKKEFYTEDVGYFKDYEVFTNSEILDVIFPNSAKSDTDKDRYYNLDVGDFIIIEVYNIGKTKAEAIKDMMTFGHNSIPAIFVRAGGMILNEN